MLEEWCGVYADDHYEPFVEHQPGMITRGAYLDREGRIFWIVTDESIGQTTVMMPIEYLAFYGSETEKGDDFDAGKQYDFPDHEDGLEP